MLIGQLGMLHNGGNVISMVNELETAYGRDLAVLMKSCSLLISLNVE